MEEIRELISDYLCSAVAFTLEGIEYVIVPEKRKRFFIYIRKKDDDYKIAEAQGVEEVMNNKIFNGRSIIESDTLISDVYST